MNEINSKFNFSKQSIFNRFLLSIISIIFTGFVIRIFYSPWELPITLDGLLFFWYANDISLLGNLPQNYSPANNGWPIFLSIFFELLNSNDFMSYMTLQRIISISLSTLTVIPVYLLCKKFSDNNLALIGAVIFAIEPRIVINSTFGITEPLYIFLIVCSILLFFSWKKKLIFLSIGILSISTFVRSEAIILIIPFLIIYFFKFKDRKKIFLEIPLLIFLFILIIFPMISYRIDVTGNDSMFSRIPNINSNFYNFQDLNPTNEIQNIIFLGGWALIPFFILLIPIGIYEFSKKIDFKKLSVLTIYIFLSVPVLYAISFLPDTRYLLILYPMLCILSVFGFKKILQMFKNREKFIILFFLILLGTSSLVVLEIQKNEFQHENDALKMAKIISDKTTVINQYVTESGYLPIVGLNELNKFPTSSNEFVKYGDIKHCLNIHDCEFIIPIKDKTIKEFLDNEKNHQITHIVVDNIEKRRAPFLKDIFQNENKYSFLKKIYDSNDEYSQYRVKIFEFDISKYKSEYLN